MRTPFRAGHRLYSAPEPWRLSPPPVGAGRCARRLRRVLGHQQRLERRRLVERQRAATRSSRWSATRPRRRPTAALTDGVRSRPAAARASASASRSAPRARRAARSTPASRRTSSRSRPTPDMTRLVKDGIVAKQLGRQPRQGDVERLGRGDRRPQGQPQAHHRLGRPDQARRRRDHPEPVDLGQRALEHPGRLRRRS